MSAVAFRPILLAAPLTRMRIAAMILPLLPMILPVSFLAQEMIIGKSGKIIAAIRILVSGAASKIGLKATADIDE